MAGARGARFGAAGAAAAAGAGGGPSARRVGGVRGGVGGGGRALRIERRWSCASRRVIRLWWRSHAIATAAERPRPDLQWM
jgi:hypothetical protein